jgi:hypothetical protein
VWGKKKRTHGRRKEGEKEENEPVIFHLPVAWWVNITFLFRRDAVKSGSMADFVLYCENLLLPESCVAVYPFGSDSSVLVVNLH